MAKMGRPTDDPKGQRKNFRLSDNDIKKLEYCSKELNKPESEVIRISIDKLYSGLKKKFRKE
ncbi:MAG: hypothetical protein K5868_06435 [Lachnospiraceae bacterium]|nr:hypothetical protein [Lachnospiraceae bacterium]